MIKSLFFLSLYFSLPLMHAQSEGIAMEDQLVEAYAKITNSDNDSLRTLNHDDFYQLLKSVLDQPESFAYPFEKLPAISKLKPDDQSFRIYTWNLQNDRGEHDFYGLVQLNPKTNKNDQLLLELENQRGELQNIDNKTFGAEMWPGAVYYELQTIKKKGKVYYTLAGWRGKDKAIAQKLLDVMYFQGGKLKFGYPLFKVKNRTQRRVVFTFSGNVSMLLIYDSRVKRFVFDHLAPRNNIVSENRKFYGPDGSYQAFYYDKKTWVLEEIYDARNRNNNKDSFYNPVTKPEIED